MKRQLGTALSVLGLLAVGGAAAAINVRMLHDAGGEAAQFSMQTASDVMPLGRASATAIPMSGPDSATAGSRMDPRALGSVGAVRGGHQEGFEGERHGFGDGDRPQLTPAQMNLLRVSAMVRTDPRTVLAVAQGKIDDDALVSAVKEAAQAVGVTLKQLAEVKDLPPMRDRGHGGPGERHQFRFDSSTASAEYDD